MKQFFRKGAALLCALALLAGLLPAAGAASTPYISGNRYLNDYFRTSQPVTSHLFENQSGGLTRVEFVQDQVVVEDYDSAFRYLSGKTLPAELPIWGGFYAGTDANYLIFGQQNPSQSDSVEVVRVVKYSKDWQRLGQASLYGENTYIPFDAGSLRCAEYGGYLYVRTCHEMYASSDGLHHQANMSFTLRTGDMTITECYGQVAYSPAGYASHSFNQFLLVDNRGELVALDHGDAYPRSIVLTKYGSPAGSDTLTGYSTEVDIQTFPGAIGDNYTGAALGGLAQTSQGYLAAYCYNGTGSGYQNRSVYLGLVNEDCSQATTRRVSDQSASTPMLVPTGLEGGWVMWNSMSVSNPNSTLCYAAYQADGSTGPIRTAVAPLSDCQPILYQGQAVWYVTDGSSLVFYTLDDNGVTMHVTVAPAFTDVPDDAWYAQDVALAACSGLMQGSGGNRFQPTGILTLGEVITVAARLYAQEHGESVPASANSQAWYQSAYDYCVNRGLFTTGEFPASVMGQSATRFQMVDLLDRAVTDSRKEAIHTISDGYIPDLAQSDSYGDTVYQWYRAGILEGDESHRFNGSSRISRAETATILCRLAGLSPRV